MKKVILGIALAIAAMSAQAATWWVGGTLYGNVCRNGIYYTVYPTSYGQPVGTGCPVRDNFGNIVGFGVVTNE